MKSNGTAYVNVIIKSCWVNRVGQNSLIHGFVELHDVMRVWVNPLGFGTFRYLKGVHSHSLATCSEWLQPQHWTKGPRELIVL